MYTDLNLEVLFPEKKGVNYKLLHTSIEGLYSITRRGDGQRLLQKMLSIIESPESKHITDATGSIGGDTILFGLHFKSVDSIERDHATMLMLKHNVNVYGLTNINIHHGDATSIFNWNTDVLYVDPPWGGPDYKIKDLLELFMGDIKLDDWLTHILQQAIKPKYIFLKLPSNYNFDSLNYLPNVIKIHKFTIRKFILFGLTVN
jgi:hypothetical protein